VEDDLKSRCKSLFEKQGITISQVLKKYLTAIASEENTHFNIMPNEITKESIRKTKDGIGIKKFESSRDLKKYLVNL
jgi:antitoxin component of RelBE/YafQ-DinJ toxin-antitoxin module